MKRRTETDLLALPFWAAYTFRPAGMEPLRSQLHVRWLYRLFSWLLPLARPFHCVSTLEIGLATLHVAEHINSAKIL